MNVHMNKISLDDSKYYSNVEEYSKILHFFFKNKLFKNNILRTLFIKNITQY